MPNHPLGQHSSLLLPGKELKQLSGLFFSFIGNMPVARGLRLYAKEYSHEENNKEKENGSTHSQTHKELCKGENKWSAWYHPDFPLLPHSDQAWAHLCHACCLIPCILAPSPGEQQDL